LLRKARIHYFTGIGNDFFQKAFQNAGVAVFLKMDPGRIYFLQHFSALKACQAVGSLTKKSHGQARHLLFI
jgi:hypothetical protein